MRCPQQFSRLVDENEEGDNTVDDKVSIYVSHLYIKTQNFGEIEGGRKFEPYFGRNVEAPAASK